SSFWERLLHSGRGLRPRTPAPSTPPNLSGILPSNPYQPLEVRVPKSDRFSRDRLTVERGFWPKFRRVARRIPFAEDLLAAYYAAIDPKTPFSVRATLFGALAYFVMPADLIPDF